MIRGLQNAMNLPYMPKPSPWNEDARKQSYTKAPWSTSFLEDTAELMCSHFKVSGVTCYQARFKLRLPSLKARHLLEYCNVTKQIIFLSSIYNSFVHYRGTLGGEVLSAMHFTLKSMYCLAVMPPNVFLSHALQKSMWFLFDIQC